MSNKETKAKVANAFRAMKSLGISEDKVKPVLKNLLKLYDKNWELIEEENYRALADAIFEREEAEAVEQSKKVVTSEAAEHSKEITNSEKQNYLDEEAQAAEEPERPLKRLRRRYRDGQSSSSNAPSNSDPRIPLVRPKEEPNELPETCPPKLNASQAIEESPQATVENARVNSQGVRCQLAGKNKGKQPISPNSLVVLEVCDPCQASGTSRSQQNTQSITESRSPSHPMRLRDRGKGTVSPQMPSRRKRSVPENSSLAVCLKEPKVEPGIDQSPQQKSIASHTLIKPKDEPVTDDMPPPVVPIAVVHPDPSNGGDSLSGNGTIREHERLEPSASMPMNEKETADRIATPNESRNNGEQALISDQCSSNLEIASSPFGEVKISLSCDLARGRPDFRMPSLESVLKLVEEKCFKSYKSLDPNFSVMNLMKEMCQCFLKLGSGSDRESPATINVTHDLNGSIDPQFDAEATLQEAPVFPTFCNDIDDGASPKKMDGGEHGTIIENKENCAEKMNNLSLVVA
ncbi:Histone-lysine N-methyltransferase [Handroanthus impetiginosus]|uniref:Histone-lysine N-methyltransferase n=1 Tax=Handroanthus impetiginosus TaxID=429701 RepID=A0A2G9GK13_9LAMI|nr:Histone-lysine N-methyltransferase [Handroanthus impetiginosus]